MRTGWRRVVGAMAIMAMAIMTMVSCAPAGRSGPPTTGAQADPQREAPPPAPRNDTAALAGGEYVLQRGDIIDLKFFYAPELNESTPIRPDGKLMLQLVGEIQADGKTPRELAEVLRDRYQAILVKPEVAVIVRKFTGLRAYVGGEVNAPGLITFDRPVTLTQALVQAGWIKNTAEPRNVVVLRDQGDRVPEVLFFDLRAFIARPNGREDLPLRPYDVVYVPKSTVAKVGEFVEQYLDKIFLTPISRLAGFAFVYTLNNPTGTIRTQPSTLPE
jgi:protein involved in polysaccharide export with SLBB domain